VNRLRHNFFRLQGFSDPREVTDPAGEEILEGDSDSVGGVTIDLDRMSTVTATKIILQRSSVKAPFVTKSILPWSLSTYPLLMGERAASTSVALRQVENITTLFKMGMGFG
jgi:hypothetical protein